MIRLRVREFVAENAPGLNRYELARRANLSYKFVDKIWREPANTHIYFDGLAAIAEALSQYLQRKIHLSELFEDDTENR